MIRRLFLWLRENVFSEYETVVDFTRHVREQDIKKSKVAAVLGYLIFFIPLVFADDLQFARFHCNQSILNLLLSTVGAVLWSFIPVVGPFLVLIQEIACFIFMIRGMILAARGKAVGIPLVGWITILPYRLPGQGPVIKE